MRNKLIAAMTAGLVAWSPAAYAETFVDQELEAGVQQTDVEGDRYQFEEYDHTPDGIVIPSYGLTAGTDALRLEFEASDIREDDQEAELRLKGRRWNAFGSWNQQPHNYDRDAVTIFNETNGGSRLFIPTQIRSGLSTNTTTYQSQLNSLLTGARNADLAQRTDTGSLGVVLGVTERLKVNITGSEQIRKGHRPIGSTFISANTLELPLPVDSKTYESEVGLNYGGKTAQMGLNYRLSSFQNDVEVLTWDNPRRTVDVSGESSQGRMSVAPDNIAHFLGFNGGADLPYRSRIDANVDFAYFRQNEQLLPFTINSAVPDQPFDLSDPANLPRQTADAKVLEWSQNYALSTRWTNKINSAVKFDSRDLNYETAEWNSPASVWSDTSLSTVTTTSTANFSSRKNVLGAELGYQALKRLGLDAGYSHAWIRRNDREVPESQEDSISLGARSRLGIANIRGSYEHTVREMDEFHVAHLTDAGESAALRRYDVGDRVRDAGSLNVRASKGIWSGGVNAAMGHTIYKVGSQDIANDLVNARLGLLESEDVSVGGDIDVSFDRIGFFSFYQYDRDDSVERGNRNPRTVATAANSYWTRDVMQEYHSGGVGMTVIPASRVDVTLGWDGHRSKADMNYTQFGSAVVVAVPIPEVTATRHDYYVKGKYTVSPKTSVALGYVFQEYDVTNYQYDHALVTGGTSATNLFLGNLETDYRAHIVTATINQKF